MTYDTLQSERSTTTCFYGLSFYWFIPQVLPPDDSKLTTELTALSEGSTSTLDLYLEKGDTQSATKLMNTLASVLNENTEAQSGGSGLDDEDVTQDADWVLQKKHVSYLTTPEKSCFKLLCLII